MLAMTRPTYDAGMRKAPHLSSFAHVSAQAVTSLAEIGTVKGSCHRTKTFRVDIVSRHERQAEVDRSWFDERQIHQSAIRCCMRWSKHWREHHGQVSHVAAAAAHSLMTALF